jgi:hypothetical protein
MDDEIPYCTIDRPNSMADETTKKIRKAPNQNQLRTQPSISQI